MRGRRPFLGGLLSAAAAPALAQGFAGLGTGAEGFAVPERGPFNFPADHGPHPAFRIEWWYVTCNLRLPDGTPAGVQWTLFRSALRPEDGEGWSAPQLWMGHMGLTLPERHVAAERLARGGIGQAGAAAEPFEAWIDEWSMEGPTLADVRMRAFGPRDGYDLRLVADGPFVAQGEGGYSVKSREGQASRYYSQPFYRVEGTLFVDGGEVPVTGRGWLDREWSSQPLSEGQTGWDWFSLRLDEGEGTEGGPEGFGAAMMGFRLRDAAGDYTSATWIAPDGAAAPMPAGALRAEPLEEAVVAGRTVPVVWRVALPERGVDVTLRAVNPAAWMDLRVPYWEGPVTVEGSHRGEGYLEMTGYEAPADAARAGLEPVE